MPAASAAGWHRADPQHRDLIVLHENLAPTVSAVWILLDVLKLDVLFQCLRIMAGRMRFAPRGFFSETRLVLNDELNSHSIFKWRP